jgi:ABC-2 type transport system permease protein
MNRHVETFRKYRYLLADLIVRDLKVKYRRSVLGLLWSILNPLLMMFVISAVFSRIFKFDVEYFPIFYLTGAVVFNFVVESTSSAMTAIINAAPLIKKVYVPKYLFPLEKTLFAFVNLLFSLVAVAVVILVLRMPLHWTALLFPIPLLYVLVFSVGLGMILSAYNVFYRDIQHLYSVWTTAWLYLTPVIYPVSILPSVMQKAVAFNPLYYYVDYFREVVMYGHIPGLRENLVCMGFSALFLLVGLWVFRRKQERFILYI